MMKSFWKIWALVVLCVCCAACAPQAVREQSEAVAQVDNFTFFGEPQQVKVYATPKRAVVYGASALDTLLALQVGDNIAAAVVTDGASPDEYRRRLPRAQIYGQALTLEKVVELQPDFLLAWRRFFAASQLGDTAVWLQRGVPAYIQDASGPVPAKGNFPACTVESEMNFIRNMGIVFAKRHASEKIIADIQSRLTQSDVLPPSANRVLVVEFINGTIEVFGKDLLSGDIIKRFGGDVIEYGAPFVSQDELTTLDVDYIFVVYHGGEQEAEAALQNLRHPLYRHLRAVRQGKVFPLNYRLIVAPGINVIKSLDYIRQCLFIKR